MRNFIFSTSAMWNCGHKLRVCNLILRTQLLKKILKQISFGKKTLHVVGPDFFGPIRNSWKNIFGQKAENIEVADILFLFAITDVLNMKFLRFRNCLIYYFLNRVLLKISVYRYRIFQRDFYSFSFRQGYFSNCIWRKIFIGDKIRYFL